MESPHHEPASGAAGASGNPGAAGGVPAGRPGHPERRRPAWREFRRSYPGILLTMALALVAFLAFDGWLVYKRVKYQREIERLRGGMSDAERRRTDMLVEENENKFRLMVELIRRQAQGDKELHLSVAVDSGEIYLEREGAILREMRAEVGPEVWVRADHDSVLIAAPRGTRTVERIFDAGEAWEIPAWVYTQRGLPVPDERKLKGALGPLAIQLNGGTVIYSMPTAGPLNDSSYVLPGSIRTRLRDLQAVAPNLKAGMNVYFY